MIDVKILSEKLKYLIIMNSKPNFDIQEIYFDFDYNKNKIDNYDVNIKFDYNGGLDNDINSFGYDIKRMSEKLQDIIDEYTITQEGKIINFPVSGGIVQCHELNKLLKSLCSSGMAYWITVSSGDNNTIFPFAGVPEPFT